MGRTPVKSISRAAEQSAFIRGLVDTGDIYHPLSWSPKEAHRFLCEIALYEQAGLVVRMADDYLFRGYWQGTEKLFANALFFGSLVDYTPAPEEVVRATFCGT